MYDKKDLPEINSNSVILNIYKLKIIDVSWVTSILQILKVLGKKEAK